MAIQWMDDFTSYGTDASRSTRMLDGPYAELDASVSTAADPDPSAGGGYVLQVGSNANARIRKVFTGPLTTVGVAARYWLTALPTDGSIIPWLAGFSDTGNALHVIISVNPSGYIEAYRLDTSGRVLVAQTSSPVVIANAWRHYECKVVLDATAGSIEVRQEGITVLSVSGIRTTSNVSGVAGTALNFLIRNERVISSGPTIYVKDLIIWDSAGSSNNNFMGSCQVYKIIPDGDVSLNWTTSSGTTGWNLINETTPDDDIGYIAAGNPPPSASTFSMTDLPVNVTSVRGVQVVHRSRKSDGGDGTMQTSVITTDGTSNGADKTITTAYTYWWDIFDKAPTNINWTKTLVEGINLKLNRTL